MRLLLPVLFLAVTAAAQVRESVTVELIEVPVYVTLDGKPVRNLTREAFQLRVNGKQQPVEYFDSLDFATARPTEESAKPTPSSVPAAAPNLRARRLYVLLFDLYYTTLQNLERSQRAAEKLIDRNKNADDLYAVATYSSRDGVHFVTSFIRDRDVLRVAIRKLRRFDARDSLALGMVEHDRVMQTSDIGLDAELASMIEGGPAMKDVRLEYERERAQHQFLSLQELAARLNALEGQKHVIHFGGGWNPGILKIPSPSDDNYMEDPSMRSGMERMAEAFRAAGTMLHGLYIKPLAVAGTTNRRVMVAADDPMHRMADATGGTFVHNTNDLATAVEDLVDSQEHVYILGFQRRTNGEGKIDVRVSGLPRGANVSFRPGFGAATQKRGPLDPLQIADILLNDVPQNGLALKSGVTTTEKAAEIAVAFSRAEVVPQLPEGGGTLDVYLYVFDKNGAVVETMSKQLAFDESSRVPTGWVTLKETFQLPPGTYAAKALVRVAGTSVLGFSRNDFTIGE